MHIQDSIWSGVRGDSVHQIQYTQGRGCEQLLHDCHRRPKGGGSITQLAIWSDSLLLLPWQPKNTVLSHVYIHFTTVQILDMLILYAGTKINTNDIKFCLDNAISTHILILSVWEISYSLEPWSPHCVWQDKQWIQNNYTSWCHVAVYLFLPGTITAGPAQNWGWSWSEY